MDRCLEKIRGSVDFEIGGKEQFFQILPQKEANEDFDYNIGFRCINRNFRKKITNAHPIYKKIIASNDTIAITDIRYTKIYMVF